MLKRVRQLTPRQVAARKNGKLGGLARAKSLSPERRRDIASKAGTQTHTNYGDDFFSFIAGRRRRVGRYRTLVANA